MTKSHISTIEAGLCAITIETAWRLATGLQISPTYLFVFPEENDYDALAELIRKLTPTEYPRVTAIIQRFL